MHGESDRCWSPTFLLLCAHLSICDGERQMMSGKALLNALAYSNFAHTKKTHCASIQKQASHGTVLKKVCLGLQNPESPRQLRLIQSASWRGAGLENNTGSCIGTLADWLLHCSLHRATLGGGSEAVAGLKHYSQYWEYLKHDHISPFLARLHSLVVCVWTRFKVLMLTYKALNVLRPCYLRVRAPRPQISHLHHLTVLDAANGFLKGVLELFSQKPGLPRVVAAD